MRYLAAMLVAGALALSGCGLLGSKPAESPEMLGGSVRVALPEVGSLDPALAGKNAQLILSTACDGLTALDPAEGRAEGAVVDSWRLEDGAKTLALTLRKGQRFHDGSAVDARSIIANLSRLARPDTHSPYASLLSLVTGFAEVQSGAAGALAGVRGTGEYTLTFSFDSPAADFPVVLAHPAFIPIAVAEVEKEPDQPIFPVCSGPYRIETVATTHALKRDRSYRGRNVANSPAAIPDSITVREYGSEEEAFDALAKGDADAAPVPSARAAEQSAGLLHRPTAEVALLAFDVSRPPTADARLRQAISLVIDRFAIVDAAYGDGRTAMTRWLSTEAQTADSNCALYAKRRNADPKRAQQLFGEAGPPQGLKLPLFFDTDRFSRLVGQAIKVQVQDALGIELDPQALDAAAFDASIRTRPATGVWLTSASSPVPVLRGVFVSLFASGGTNNLVGLSRPEADILLDQARASVDDTARSNLYEQAEQTICGEMPSVPLWSGVATWATKGMDVPATNPIDPFGNLMLRRIRGRASAEP